MANLGKSIFLAVGLAVLFSLAIHLVLKIALPAPEYPIATCVPTTGTTSGCGTVYDQAQAQYQNDLDVYQRQLFIYSLVIGVGLIALGVIMNGSALIWALMLSGIVQIFIGAASYWNNLSDWFRLGLVAGGIAFLILVAKKKKII